MQMPTHAFKYFLTASAQLGFNQSRIFFCWPFPHCIDISQKKNPSRTLIPPRFYAWNLLKRFLFVKTNNTWMYRGWHLHKIVVTFGLVYDLLPVGGCFCCWCMFVWDLNVTPSPKITSIGIHPGSFLLQFVVWYTTQHPPYWLWVSFWKSCRNSPNAALE